MSDKILVLSEYAFGKTISASGSQEPSLGVDIKGLDPATTYFISATSKNLPGRGSMYKWPVVIPDATYSNLGYGRRVICQGPDAGYQAANIIWALSPIPEITDIVIDDTNYMMQDYMMAESLKAGWDAPKKAAHFMGKLFSAMEVAGQYGKTIWMLAHFDSKKKSNNGDITFKMKTTGNQTDDMIAPEGKFNVILYGLSEWDNNENKLRRYYLTTDDGTFKGRSDPGMFPKHIPNDLGYVKAAMIAYHRGEPMPETGLDAMKITGKTREQPKTILVPPTPPVTPPPSGLPVPPNLPLPPVPPTPPELRSLNDMTSPVPPPAPLGA